MIPLELCRQYQRPQFAIPPLQSSKCFLGFLADSYQSENRVIPCYRQSYLRQKLICQLHCMVEEDPVLYTVVKKNTVEKNCVALVIRNNG
jgi:hypothetical protein